MTVLRNGRVENAFSTHYERCAEKKKGCTESWRRAFAFDARLTAKDSERLDSIRAILKGVNGASDLIERFDACHKTLPLTHPPPPLPSLHSLCLTLSSSQIRCKSARAIAMATESVILACATASQDSTAWTAPKVSGCFTKCVFFRRKRG